MSIEISVLMATRNKCDTLGRAVASILRQTVSEFELIIVDDQSEDRTPEVLRQLSDPRLIVLRNSQRHGLAASLNLAATKARANLFARMDDDDESVPFRFERQLAEFRTLPDVEVLGSGILVAAKGRVIGEQRRPCDHEALVRDIHRRNPFFHPTVVMRRQFFLRNRGYSEGMMRAQDYDLWLRGYRSSCYRNIPEPLVTYTASTPKWENAVFSSRALMRAYARERELRFGLSAMRPMFAHLVQAALRRCRLSA